jgi:hypothetical protein
MIENYFLKLDLTLEQSLVMAAFGQTIFITDLSPWFGFDI